MPLKLIRPGTRKGNTFWLVRGSFAGRRIEVSSGARDEEAAERFKAELVLRLSAGEGDPAPTELTFSEAVLQYAAYRKPSKPDRRRLERLVDVLGPRTVKSLVHADLVAAANRLCPGLKAATKNREAMRPAAAVLHYASDNGHRDWLRVKLFKEPKPTTRAVTTETARDLIAATAGKKRLLLIWLFKHGTRITDTLQLDWPNLDLQARTYRLWISKKQEWRTFPIDDDIWIELANEDKETPLWPWKSRSGVYNWLRPLCRRLRLTFTPHMGRHSLGTWLNAGGAGQKTIMAALGQDDPKSAARYTSADVEIVRAAQAKLKKLGGQR